MSLRNVRLVIVPRELIESFLREALSADVEVGGVLIGRALGDKVVVTKLIVGENVKRSPYLFELSSETLAKVAREVDEEDVVGIIHSHIYGGCRPSDIDLKYMELWPVIWMIVSTKNAEIKAWYFNREVELVVA